MPTDRDVALSLIGSLCLCDHMGDVSNDIDLALKQLGVKIDWDDFDELALVLHKMGVKTLVGTELYSKDEDDDAH